MIQQLGDFPVNAIVRFLWSTNGQDGASITRAVNGSLRIYKNDSVTERASAVGITDTEDFDTLTGVHHCKIDLSDNTDAGFYAAGSDYFVVLAAATIDTKTVNAPLAQFSIGKKPENQSQVRYTLNGGSTEQRAMSLLNQVTQRGQAQYQFTPADLPAAGVIVGEVRLQAGLSDQLTTVDQFYLAVRAPLP